MSRYLILRRRQTPPFKVGFEAPLSINPEQTPAFRPGKVEGLISKWNNKGLFLVEVLLTVAILSVGLTLIIRSYVSSLRASVYTSDYSLATVLLENKMSDLLQKGFIEDGLRQEETFLKPHEKFSYALETHNVSDDAGAGLLNEVMLTVSWLSGSRKKSVTTTTYLFNFPE